jgi:SAM-dependent MidA family methyltransferase
MLFSEFFNSWLYSKEGYYNNFKTIGKQGDFYTAVSTSDFFGASIANFIYTQMQKKGLPKDIALVEVGAHQGYLICDMIRWLFTCEPSLIDSMRFYIVEKQPAVQAAQKEYINSQFGSDVTVKIVDCLEAVNEEEIFVVANEIFDAFACELVYEDKICHIDKTSLHPFWLENTDEAIKQKAARYGIVKGEVAIGYEDFAKELANSAKKINFLSFDYGDKGARNDFSVRIYKDHKVYPFFENGLDMELLYKKSDITVDVNFMHLIDAFEQAGFCTLSYRTQNSALIDFGLMDILEKYAKVATQKQYIRQVNKIKTLIDPTMMGERFKAVHFQKGYE